MKIKNKGFVISTYIYSTLKGAEKQVNKWQEEGSLNEDTKVYEITGVIYKPEMKLVKQK